MGQDWATKDALFHVLTKCDPKDVARCSCVCRDWRLAASDSALWKQLVTGAWKRWYPLDGRAGSIPGSSSEWKRLHQQRLSIASEVRQVAKYDASSNNRRMDCIRSIFPYGSASLEEVERLEGLGGDWHLGLRTRARVVGERIRENMSQEELGNILCGNAHGKCTTMVEQGAIAISLMLNPMESGEIISALDSLGDSLRTRLECQLPAGKDAHSLDGLRILNAFMFNPPSNDRQDEGGEDDVHPLPGPPDGNSEEGLGLAGNTHDYYDPQNSSIASVLKRRTGIPISLSVVYIAVAKRAAIDLEPISYPEHFLVRFTASGLEEERFVDVFNGGTLYTRSAMTDASPDDLEPCRPIAVWQRMLNNLLVIFRQHYRDANKLKATLGAMLTLDPSNNQARDLRFRAAVKVYDYSLAREDVKKLDSPEREVESLLSNIDSQKNHLVRSCNQKKFRGDSLAFMCGTVYRHRRHGYIGLITSYDTTCQASTFWQIQMNVSSLPRGEQQPFYHSLVDTAFRQGPAAYTYVAEDNIDPFPPGQAPKVNHPEVAHEMEGFIQSRGMYLPNFLNRSIYPEDVPAAGLDDVLGAFMREDQALLSELAQAPSDSFCEYDSE